MAELTARRLPMLVHDLARYHLEREGEAEGNDNQVIEHPEHRNEIRNQVYRAECIGHNETRHELREPGDARVPRCEVEGVRI